MPATFNDLVALMDRLRSPNGCPWDREQTYATLAPMLLEEAYEAFEAVEDAREGRPAELCDELGDLLFQIVFYAQVAKERGEFTIDDVTTAIHDKMVRRHPHVFGDVTAEDAATVLLNWETMKAEERRAAGKTERRQNVAADRRLVKSAGVDGSSSTVDESRARRFRLEICRRHLRQVTGRDRGAAHARSKTTQTLKDEANHARVREEMGDLLFAATNIARHMQVEPEAALKLTNRKFRQRFEYIENCASRSRAGV